MDLTHNAREWRRYSTGGQEGMERATLADAFDIRVQNTGTLDVSPQKFQGCLIALVRRCDSCCGADSMWRGTVIVLRLSRLGTVDFTIKTRIPPRGLNDVNLIKRKAS
jgi:hypothetical protein